MIGVGSGSGAVSDAEWWTQWFSLLRGIAEDLGDTQEERFGGGLWSVSKLAYVGAYAYKVFDIVGGKHFDNLYYIDLLAGDGLTTVIDSEGNEEAIAGSALGVPALPGFDHVFVNDQDEGKIQQLEDRVGRLRGDYDLPDYSFYSGDANDVADAIIDDIWESYNRTRESFLTMTFVDNQGFDVNYETIRRLCEIKNDLHILFPSSHFWMNAKGKRERSESFPAATEFFGSEDWAEAESGEDGARIYMDRVVECGDDERVGGPMPKIRGKKNHHYHLVSSVEKTSGGSGFLDAAERLSQRVDELAWSTITAHHDVASGRLQSLLDYSSSTSEDSQDSDQSTLSEF